MKLTKKQCNELYNCFPGVGVLFLNLGNNTILSIDFWQGQNGIFYTTASSTKNKPLDIYLHEIKKEIINER